MFLRSLVSGFLLAAILPAPAFAEQALPAGVINVALPEFGDRIAGGDYGLANINPIEIDRSMSRGQEIRIVRALRHLRLSRRGEARFQVLVGDAEQIYFWLESPPIQGAWQVELSVVYADGYREAIVGDDWLREGLYFARVPSKALLEFRVNSKERNLKLGKRFIFTVSPVNLSLWSDFRPVPYTYERGIISP